MLIGLIGLWETLAVLAMVVCLSAARWSEEFMRGLGQGISEFLKASRNMNDAIQRSLDEVASQNVEEAESSASRFSKHGEFIGFILLLVAAAACLTLCGLLL